MPIDVPLYYNEIEKIVNIYGTPLQLYDVDGVLINSIKYNTTFLKYFSNYKQFFAVKALPNPIIMNKLKKIANFGFDCSSINEIYLAKLAGCEKGDIMYTSNYTSINDLIDAMKNNVILNLDDIDILDNLQEALKEVPEYLIENKLISFRLNPNIGKTNSETKSNILGGSGSKFGIPDFDIIKAYEIAQKIGFTEFGIHIMCGSCVTDPEYWIDIISSLYKTIAIINKSLNIKFKFINIGGGFGIPYKPDELPLDLDLVVKNIKNTIDKCKLYYDIDFDPAIYTENGRYITGPFGWLITKCNAIKKSYNSQIFFGLDACMSNLMRPGMYGSYHHITIPRISGIDTKDIKLICANVVGTLCENNDWFAKNRFLPEDTKKGELFVIHDTGAHSHSMGFQYNSKLKAPEIMIFNNKIELCRYGDTFEDIIQKYPIGVFNLNLKILN
jgi:diaminopimelate decarboxylase